MLHEKPTWPADSATYNTHGWSFGIRQPFRMNVYVANEAVPSLQRKQLIPITTFHTSTTSDFATERR
jgi:hypothetical protein